MTNVPALIDSNEEYAVKIVAYTDMPIPTLALNKNRRPFFKRVKHYTNNADTTPRYVSVRNASNAQVTAPHMTYTETAKAFTLIQEQIAHRYTMPQSLVVDVVDNGLQIFRNTPAQSFPGLNYNRSMLGGASATTLGVGSFMDSYKSAGGHYEEVQVSKSASRIGHLSEITKDWQWFNTAENILGHNREFTKDEATVHLERLKSASKPRKQRYALK